MSKVQDPRIPNVVTDIGPVREHVRPVAEEIAARWLLYFVWGAPGRGTGDHSRGLALDFMTYELGDGVDDPGPRRYWIGQEIATHFVLDRRRLNVAYLIWHGRIISGTRKYVDGRWYEPWQWRPYEGDNPHIDHVHVSFTTTGTYEPPEDEMTAEDRVWITQQLAAMEQRIKAASKAEYQSLLKHNTIIEGREVRRDAGQDARIEQAFETEGETP